MQLYMTTAQRAAIESEADAAGQSVSAIIRDCIGRALPLVRDSRQKRERSARRRGADHEADA